MSVNFILIGGISNTLERKTKKDEPSFEEEVGERAMEFFNSEFLKMFEGDQNVQTK